MIRAWLQSRLAREGALKATSTGLAVAVGFVASVLLARALPSEQLGSYVLLLSLVQVGVLLADGGLGQATTRFIATAGQYGPRARVLLQSLGGRALVAAAVVALYALLAPAVLTQLLPAHWVAHVRVPLLLLVLLKATFLLWPAVERGRRRWVVEGSLLLAEAVGIAALYAWAWSRGGADVAELLRGLLTLYGALAALTLAMVLRALLRARGAAAEAALGHPLSTDAGDVRSEPPPGVGGLLRFGLPLLANGSFFFALVTLDRIALGAMRPKAELAIYYVAINLATAGRIGFTVLEQVLYTHLSATCRPDSPQLPSVYRRVFAMFAAGALALCVAGGAAGHVVIPWAYGSEYAASVGPFVFLLAVLAVRVVSIPASLFLIVVFRQPRRTQDALLTAFVAAVVLWFCLIPRWGIYGAVLSALGAFGLATAWQLLAVWRMGLRPDPRFLRWYLPLASGWAIGMAGAHTGILPMAVFWVVEVVTAIVLAVALLRPDAARVPAPMLRPEGRA